MITAEEKTAGLLQKVIIYMFLNPEADRVPPQKICPQVKIALFQPISTLGNKVFGKY